MFLNAADIPRFVGEGNVDLGITGRDRIHEAQMESQVKEVLQLGFGRCKLQIQVPENGPIQSVEDLSGKRIATSYSNVGGAYFRDIDERVGNGPTKIEYISGSVEAACALGLADGIGEYFNCSRLQCSRSDPRLRLFSLKWIWSVCDLSSNAPPLPRYPRPRNISH